MRESTLRSHKQRPGKSYKAKFTLIGIVLVVLGIAPLLYQFMPRHVDHVTTLQAIPLKTGINKIGNLTLILGKDGVVTEVKRLNRRVAHPVFGFKNARAFLIAIGPFFSLLSFCLFFIWYDRQEKYRSLILLKRYVLGIFLLTSIGLTYWALVPQDDPIPYLLYCLGLGIAAIASVAAVYFLIKHRLSAFEITRGIVASLKSYIHEVRTKHYFRVVMKALDKEGSCEEACQNIHAYEKRTAEELDKLKDNHYAT